MCGRASLTASPEEIEEAFGLGDTPAVSPRYNIAPSEPMLVVRSTGAGEREAAFVRWGLVRPGSEDAKAPINMPIESVARGAMRRTLRQGRCIIPLTGFYEWKGVAGRKRPYAITLPDHATGDLVSGEYYHRYLEDMHREFAERIDGPIILHICGRTVDRMPYIANTGMASERAKVNANVSNLFKSSKLPFSSVNPCCT